MWTCRGMGQRGLKHSWGKFRNRSLTPFLAGAHAEVVHLPSRTQQSGPLGNELVHLRRWLVLTAR